MSRIKEHEKGVDNRRTKRIALGVMGAVGLLIGFVVMDLENIKFSLEQLGMLGYSILCDLRSHDWYDIV